MIYSYLSVQFSPPLSRKMFHLSLFQLCYVQKAVLTNSRSSNIFVNTPYNVEDGIILLLEDNNNSIEFNEYQTFYSIKIIICYIVENIFLQTPR